MKSKDTEVAVLAGGCFWCMEAIFNEVKGVIKVVPGYSGRTVNSPTKKFALEKLDMRKL